MDITLYKIPLGWATSRKPRMKSLQPRTRHFVAFSPASDHVLRHSATEGRGLEPYPIRGADAGTVQSGAQPDRRARLPGSGGAFVSLSAALAGSSVLGVLGAGKPGWPPQPLAL